MRIPRLSLVLLLLPAACTEQSLAPDAQATRPALAALQVGGGVVHRVVVGGPDNCSATGDHPGCDGNYSMSVLEMADGSVSGEWQDVWGGLGTPAMSAHITVTCLEIQEIKDVGGGVVARRAWIGGVLTRPEELAGHPAITRVVDWGTSNNDDADVLGFTIVDPQDIGRSTNCHTQPFVGGRFVPEGQVKIW